MKTVSDLPNISIEKHLYEFLTNGNLKGCQYFRYTLEANRQKATHVIIR